MTKLTAYRVLAPAILILLGVEFSNAEETKPPLAPGFYHIQLHKEDTIESRIVEICNIRRDNSFKRALLDDIFKDRGYMDVAWIGTWPDDFRETEQQNQIRTTGIFNPTTIEMAIPDSNTFGLRVYFFSFELTPGKNGNHKGKGYVAYTGSKGPTTINLTCELEPLRNFNPPKGAKR